MTYLYEIGAIRWRRNPPGDPRGYRPDKGWEAQADMLDYHPTTGKPLKSAQWWIREIYTGKSK